MAKLKSNFNKTKRFAPKNNKKRATGFELNESSARPFKPKKLDM